MSFEILGTAYFSLLHLAALDKTRALQGKIMRIYGVSANGQGFPKYLGLLVERVHFCEVR